LTQFKTTENLPNIFAPFSRIPYLERKSATKVQSLVQLFAIKLSTKYQHILLINNTL